MGAEILLEDIEYINTLSVLEYNALRESAGWGTVKENRAQIGLDNSAFILAARHSDGRTIGMARVVSDGGYVVYISDVVVLPEFQGRGIGKKMMQIVMDYINSTAEDDFTMMVTLVSAKGRESFYNQFGFIARPSEKYGAGMCQWINNNSFGGDGDDK